MKTQNHNNFGDSTLPLEHLSCAIYELWNARLAKPSRFMKYNLFAPYSTRLSQHSTRPDIFQLREFTYDSESSSEFSDNCENIWIYSDDGFELISVPLPIEYEFEPCTSYVYTDILNYCFDRNTGRVWLDHVTCSYLSQSLRMLYSYQYQVSSNPNEQTITLADMGKPKKRKIKFTRKDVLRPSDLAKYK